MSMMNAFNKCYKTVEKRGYLRRILTALTIVILLVFIAFISIFFAVLSRQHLYLLSLDREVLYYFVLAFKYILFLLVFFFAISVIYYMAPSISVRWKFFSFGSFIASLLSILFTLGFAAYINIFDSYNKLYGSIGAFIGVMLWFYAISIVLLVGFEANASLELAKRERLKKLNKERSLGIRGS
jgi:membrane protein